MNDPVPGDLNGSVIEATALANPVVRPTVPGSPWAPPQPLTQGSDPTVPTAPPLDPLPDEPSDRVRPSDPTMSMPLTDAMPRLDVPPEGMIRITRGSETRYCFPCHMDGWQALGWQAHAPSLPGADGEDGEPPIDPSEGLGVITAVKGGPYTIGVEAPGQEVQLVGSNFEPGSTVVVQPPSLATASAVKVSSLTELVFSLTTGKVLAAEDCLIAVANSVGTGPWFPIMLHERPAPSSPESTLAATAENLPDYAAMTKAQIIAEVERHYGVALDPGMTKAELVAEAELLEAKGPVSAAPIAELDEPLADDQEPALPLDLLR
ncbi:MAG: hypothetical protein NTW51_05680 [Cyanobacteria bacterium]|nr:hypothetical protein [Cyanobacteriota bacterium]